MQKASVQIGGISIAGFILSVDPAKDKDVANAISKLQPLLKSTDECFEKLYILNHQNKSCLTYEVKVAS